MSGAVRVRAPAKVNWTLEVLGKRPDGYHEVRTVLQTIDLADSVTLTPASNLYLTCSDAALASEANLAYRAAARLREASGAPAGALIAIEKRIPVAAGLGGGSSDAAATLRGLRALWGLSIADGQLAALAAELGSDVPFFLRGGTALATGRGESITPLPDIPRRAITVAWPDTPVRADKTARTYAALRPEHYSNGSCSEALVARLRASEPLRDDDLCNAFEAVLAEANPEAAAAFERARGLGRGHLCGSGPALFFLDGAPPLDAFAAAGLRAIATWTLPAAAATAIEVP